MIMKPVFTKLRLKKGDLVIIRVGSLKGKTGKIIAVHPKLNAVTVEGLNIVKKHTKPSKKYPQGGIIDMIKPINVSKVAIYDKDKNKASRIGYAFSKDGSKFRVYKSTGKEIK